MNEGSGPPKQNRKVLRKALTQVNGFCCSLLRNAYVNHRLAMMIGFVGDNRSRDTPDPIPNSEVKSWPPMILLSGKVGYCRLFQPRNRKVAGLSFAPEELHHPQIVTVTDCLKDREVVA